METAPTLSSRSSDVVCSLEKWEVVNPALAWVWQAEEMTAPEKSLEGNWSHREYGKPFTLSHSHKNGTTVIYLCLASTNHTKSGPGGLRQL